MLKKRDKKNKRKAKRAELKADPEYLKNREEKKAERK
jgi:hypothetical protein